MYYQVGDCFNSHINQWFRFAALRRLQILADKVIVSAHRNTDIEA